MVATTAKKPASGAKKPKKITLITKKKTGKLVNGNVGKPRNYDLGGGVYRFSRSRMYHKKAKWLFVTKKHPKAQTPKKLVTKEKTIGGEKNGGKRVVLVRKRRNHYPTADKIKKRHPRKFFSQHKRHVRRTIREGTVAILLAGVHKGKRVVILKVLKSGLLLVNGPFLINACPLRRVSQNYVIATKTRINMKGAVIPKHINDKYFKREHKKKLKKPAEGDIFQAKKEKYKPSEQRKADQKVVDKLVLDAIKKSPEKKQLYAYLTAMFGLRSSQFPHRLRF